MLVQADAMAPTFVHRWLLLHLAVIAWIPLHSGHWVHTQLQPSGIEVVEIEMNEIMNWNEPNSLDLDTTLPF